MSVAVARSALSTSLARYSRSWGLWLLLLVAPVGARFMIARDDGSGIQIAIGRHLPVMTSATLGVSLGIVVSTLLLPIGWMYLRANTTRRQPWQVEEVAPASRIAVALGRFAADAAVLLAMLAALTAAGWLLGVWIVDGAYQPATIALTLWLVAAPALLGLAALRILFDAVPALRGGLGDLGFLILWIASISVPAAVADRPSSLAVNMYDYAGLVRPLVGAAPSADKDFAIGSSDILPGRVPLDVMRGIESEGYIASRLVWAGIAVAVAGGAGLVYRPHTAPRRRRGAGRLARLLAAGPPRAADRSAPAARPATSPLAGLIASEFRLILPGRVYLALAGIAAATGLAGDDRHIGSAAALLVLIFGLTAHAGRSEAKGLLALTRVTATPPMLRRAAFVAAGTGWAILLALPAALIGLGPQPLLLGAATGAVAALTATLLAAFSGSGFAPRLVLLIAWYVYLST